MSDRKAVVKNADMSGEIRVSQSALRETGVSVTADASEREGRSHRRLPARRTNRNQRFAQIRRVLLGQRL